MASADDGKIQGTCSVCLRTIQLRGDHPIRHGFSAIGVQHGQHGGFHTGPCPGVSFPHLGISAEGTQWALGDALTRLEKVHGELSDLRAYPDLIWYPTKYNVRGKPLDLSKPVTLRHGEEQPWGSSAPSYDSEWRRRKAVLDNRAHELETAIATYRRVLSSWSPEKYPVTGAPKTEKTTHMERRVATARGEMIGTICRSGRRGRAIVATTCDPAQVTCKRCRTALGLPPI